MTNERSLTRSNSQRSTVSVCRPSNSDSSIPKAIIQTELDKYLSITLYDATNLYMGSLSQGKWKVANRHVIQEDEYDDLLVGIANSLTDLKSLSPELGRLGLEKAFRMLDKVVGDCGLFTLPAIWVSYLRILRYGRPDIARNFLAEASQLARQKFLRDDPLVRLLIWLRKVEITNPDMLEDVIIRAFRHCISHVKNELTSSHLTTLQLWGDYVVYLDNSSADDIREILVNLQREVQQSEEDNGADDDLTLDILSMKLYVLQSTDSMAEEAELATRDILHRVNRRWHSGERLEGSLLECWKDANHTLGTFAQNRGDLRTAAQYMDHCLSYGIKDARDNYTLQLLQDLYTQLNDSDNADSVRALRTSGTYAVLQDDVQ